jgi:hypothetical protein
MSVLCMIVGIAVIAAWHLKSGSSFWPWYVATGAATVVAGLLSVYRSLPTWLDGVAFLTPLGFALFANAATNYELFRLGVSFSAFDAYKIAPLAVAVIAPTPRWVALVAIAASGLAPVALYFLVFPPAARAAIAVQEPWLTFIFAFVALLVLRHSLKGIRMERDMERLDAERQAVDKLARIFLGLRDLTNTPLQAIEMTSKLLASESMTAAEASHYLERSLVRLRELSRVLTAYELELDWTAADTSFDAVKYLQQKITSQR